MLDFLKENSSTILLSIVILLVVISILRYLYKNKKKGKFLCGSGCQGCPMAYKCHPSKSDEK